MSFTLHQHNWQEIICSSNKSIQLLKKKLKWYYRKQARLSVNHNFQEIVFVKKCWLKMYLFLILFCLSKLFSIYSTSQWENWGFLETANSRGLNLYSFIAFHDTKTEQRRRWQLSSRPCHSGPVVALKDIAVLMGLKGPMRNELNFIKVPSGKHLYYRYCQELIGFHD